LYIFYVAIDRRLSLVVDTTSSNQRYNMAETRRKDLFTNCKTLLTMVKDLNADCFSCVIMNGPLSFRQRKMHDSSLNNFIGKCTSVLAHFKKFTIDNNTRHCFTCSSLSHSYKACPFSLRESDRAQWLFAVKGFCFRCTLPGESRDGFSFHPKQSFGFRCSNKGAEVQRFVFMSLTLFPNIVSQTVGKFVELDAIKIPSLQFRQWCLSRSKSYPDIMNITCLFSFIHGLITFYKGAKHVPNKNLQQCSSKKRKLNTTGE